MTDKSFRSLLAQAKKRDAYWVGKAIHDFTEDLYRLMEDRGMSKAELAQRIGKTPAYLTKVLRGNSNFTVDSIVKLVHALGVQLSIRIDTAKPGSERNFL
jgi:transcriptional regulator with XRE-family HTH domain